MSKIDDEKAGLAGGRASLDAAKSDPDEAKPNLKTAKSSVSPDEAQKIAAAVGEKMYAQDKAAQALGIKLLSIAPGYAKMSMLVRADMLNGFAICHGGMTFTLADTAFAYACNSRNQQTVALSCNITFATAVYSGDTLTAIAQESMLNNRTGLYDIIISNQKDIKVAFFRGNSYGTRRDGFALAP